MATLEIQSVSKSFGGVKALDNVTMSVKDKMITGLIGPNGAGKTTLFNVITNIELMDSGKVTFGDLDLSNIKPYYFAKMGILRTFQKSMPFGEMTLLENVIVGGIAASEIGKLGGFLRTKKVKNILKKDKQKAIDLLKVVGLFQEKDLLANSIPYGEQRLLEIARALACNPEILLLDEPVAGMNHEESLEMAKVIRRISQEGLTVFLIEHNLDVVMNLCDELYVINFGKNIANGSPMEIQQNEQVIGAYLGKKGV
jgi:branched-chain amino acid transport system ATP-binding protein